MLNVRQRHENLKSRIKIVLRLGEIPVAEIRGGSAGDRLLELRVRIPPGAWISVSSECCVFSGKGLCERPINRPEKSYRLLCVIV
jgi:hypothetical protein